MELWEERKRIGLVALGVAWSTLALSLLLAFGQSFVTATNQTISNFGKNILRVRGGSTTLPYQGLSSGRAIPLLVEDEEVVRRALPQARAVALEYVGGSNHPVRVGQNLISASLAGCGPAFRELRGMVPQAGGRFLNEVDVQLHRRVCFLGHRTKQRLFGDQNAIGQTIEIYKSPFTVVGVRQPRVPVSSYDGDDRDKVIIPHTAFRDLLGWTRITHLIIGLEDPLEKDQALTTLYQTLGSRKGFHPHDSDALRVVDYIAIDDMINGMLDGNRYFNAIVGIFGLMVAMLGVMNVMYVMVEERNREIGIRMALGARRSHILWNHLKEGIVVTLLGGGVGMVLCAVIFALLDQAEVDPEVRAYLGHPVLSVTLAGALVAVLGMAGCLASWFPARRAAALDPIQTLRDD